MKERKFDRAKAIAYAHRWAYGRNPDYAAFDGLGGDCTNFASQSLFAGSGVQQQGMNGWYYISLDDRAPAWSGVEQLYTFLVSNRGIGPYAEEVDVHEVLPGDLVQLRFTEGDRFRHTPVIVATQGGTLVAAHTFNADNRPLPSYTYHEARYLHIIGVRTQS